MIDVRYSLAVPFLKEYGGHIGYAVRPTERRKGYGVRMLRLALDYCRALGIQCYSDNIPSIRTIERCGSVRMEEKKYLDGKPMYLYEIPLKEQEKEEGVS